MIAGESLPSWRQSLPSPSPTSRRERRTRTGRPGPLRCGRCPGPPRRRTPTPNTVRAVASGHGGTSRRVGHAPNCPKPSRWTPPAPFMPWRVGCPPHVIGWPSQRIRTGSPRAARGSADGSGPCRCHRSSSPDRTVVTGDISGSLPHRVDRLAPAGSDVLPPP